MIKFERLYDRRVIKCFGPDSKSFLQGLITNDVRAGNCYTAMLSAKGKYLFDFFIYKSAEDEYMLDCGSAGILEQLNFYVLSSRVFLEDLSSQFSVIYSTELISKKNAMCQKDARFVKMGFRTLLASESNLSGNYVEASELYFQDKYEYAIPDGEIDMIMNKSFPAEFGLNYLNGVSYTKGCYMGQELMARLKGRQPARKVYKVSSEFNLSDISKGTPLFHDSNEVGFLCSARGSTGIALARVGTFDNTCSLDGLEVSLSLAPWHEGNS